jgi:hypothetical protein
VFSVHLLAISVVWFYWAVVYWNDSIRDWTMNFKYPAEVARADRIRSLQHLGLGLLLVFLGLLNGVLGVGLWRLKSWTSKIATVQGYALLILGFLIAMYFVLLRNDFAQVPLVLPGLILVLLAGFIRTKRSMDVLSPRFHDANLMETSTDP